MSKRKIISYFLTALVILLALSAVGYYFYQKNSGPRPPTQAEIEAKQRAELMSYTASQAGQKSEADQKKELELFKPASTTKQPTEDEMRAALTSGDQQR
jgi:uncharacterized protein (UPF0333 family)